MIHFHAAYYDGQTAARRDVQAVFAPEGLRVLVPDSEDCLWPWQQLSISAQGGLRIQRGNELVIVFDSTARDALRAAAPAVRIEGDGAASRAAAVFLAIGAICILGVIAVWKYALPAAGAAIASVVPVSFEAKLGASVAKAMAPDSSLCSNPAQQESVDRILLRLRTAARDTPYQFNVRIADSEIVNAAAAPGGSIILFSALVEKCDSPEELAGVLAHEMQHVLHRHSTRAIGREMALRLALGLIFGGMDSLAGAVAGDLAGLRYMRGDEDEADRDGLSLLHAAHIDPAGMIAFFEKLSRQSPDTPAVVEYLSTHPDPRGRVERLRALAGQSSAPAIPLMSRADWLAARACTR
jgi:predicted Zn-dependent protease